MNYGWRGSIEGDASQRGGKQRRMMSTNFGEVKLGTAQLPVIF
ncbi:MAG: hypothetical protein WBN40_05350 [Pseudomonadales bacterium]